MNSNPRLISRLGYIIILIAVSLFAASNAFAESGSVKKVVQLSKAAMEDYDNFELEDADTKLIQAVQMVENLGVTDPGVANVYVAQGIVSFGRFKDSVLSIAEDRAYTAFLKALTLNPNVTIPDDYRSDELQKIFDKAKSDIETASHSTKIAVAAAAPSVEHTPIQYNNRCTPLRILASVPSHPDIYRTFVYYSVDGQFKSEALEMKPTLESADVLEATIPALDTRGDKIVYYIEAQNRRGQVVANVSDANSPMVVTMEGECVGLTAEEKAQTYGDPLFQFSLLFGTAIGVIPDNSNTTCYYSGEAHNYYCNDSSRSGGNTNIIDQATMKRGAAILPFHMRVNAIFNLPAHFQLGIFLRAQFVNIVNDDTLPSQARKTYDKPWMYNLLLGVALRYLALHKQPYRLYVGLEFGWGGANATASLGADYHNYNAMYLYDGPWHIAPQIGFLWTLHKNVGLAFELTVPIYFPNKPTVHFDISVGPFFQF